MVKQDTSSLTPSGSPAGSEAVERWRERWLREDARRLICRHGWYRLIDALAELCRENGRCPHDRRACDWDRRAEILEHLNYRDSRGWPEDREVRP